MLFHIQSTHSYKTCGANDPEKKKIMRSAFLNAEEKGIKIHSLVGIDHLIQFTWLLNQRHLRILTKCLNQY